MRYSPSRTAQGYPRTHALLRESGSRLDYAEFLALFDEVAAAREEQAARELVEYSMEDVSGRFLERAGLGAQLIDGFVAAYLAEWSAGVELVEGVPQLLEGLAARGPRVLVTNTHSRRLIDEQLARFGLSRSFDRILTSVEFGRRKPHPAIFREALRGCGCEAGAAVYVGDSLDSDYRGAIAVGVRGLLIDPEGRHPVPERDRLRSVLELEESLTAV